MRILVVADIHANWPALAAIDEMFDACLFVGDAVDYATDPVPCIHWLERHVTAGVRGNHDHAVAQRILPPEGPGLRRLAAATRPIHWRNLDRSQRKYLARLPVTRRIVLGGLVFYLIHATPRDPLDEYLGCDAKAWESRLESVEADFVCVGHTHIPFHLDLGRLQVVNPGSVGQPRDGDPRCAYAVIDDGRVELRRVEYDIGRTLQQMKTAGVGGAELELAAAMLQTGGKGLSGMAEVAS